jgi:DNA-binding transcriptional LysR family regulator
MENLADLVVFTRVVETRSFTAAGKALHMSTSAVSKHVARLESELSLKLLQRSTHHLMTTESGAVFYAHCVKILSALETARADAAGMTGEVKGLLRVHSTSGVGLNLVAPATIDFAQAYESVTVDLAIGELPIDLTNRRLDVIIASRHFGQDDPKVYDTMASRNLGPMPYVVCASPGYLARHGRPESPYDLASHSCLIHVTQKRNPDEWFFASGADEAYSIRVRETYRSNIESAVLMAAAHGLGIARLPEYIARQELNAGRLTAIFQEIVQSGRVVKAFYPRSRHIPRKIRLFIDMVEKRYKNGSIVDDAGSTP